MKIIYTSKFAREYKKLPTEIKRIAEEKEKIFRKNPHAPELKSHKLKGKFKDFWSFSMIIDIGLFLNLAQMVSCIFTLVVIIGFINKLIIT